MFSIVNPRTLFLYPAVAATIVTGVAFVVSTEKLKLKGVGVGVVVQFGVGVNVEVIAATAVAVIWAILNFPTEAFNRASSTAPDPGVQVSEGQASRHWSNRPVTGFKSGIPAVGVIVGV